MKKTMNKIITILLFLIFSKSTFSEPTEMNTAQIMNFQADQSCVDYCFIGICVWLRCSQFECEVGWSDKIQNRNPDLLISVFNYPGDEPWREMQSLMSELHVDTTDSIVSSFSNYTNASGGQRVNPDFIEHETEDNNLRFKEANVYGHPSALIFSQNWNSDLTYWCPTEVTPFFPYYSSAFDAVEWRWGIFESLRLNTWNPFADIIGEGGVFQNWGYMYPRKGDIAHVEDPKAAAVIAARAGNIATSSNALPHLHIPLSGNNGFLFTWYPGQLEAYNPDKNVWQMRAPIDDTQCYPFGYDDTRSESWASGRTSDDQRYIFQLWRKYECCSIRGILIADIPIPPICL